MDEASKDSTWVVDTMFGNPDVPMLPTVIAEDEDLANIVNMDLLEHASGPATEEGRGLFRALCQLPWCYWRRTSKMPLHKCLSTRLPNGHLQIQIHTKR